MHTAPGLNGPGLPRLGLDALSLPRPAASPSPIAAPAAAPQEFTLGSSRHKTGKIAAIVAIHVLAAWGLSNGMVRDAVKQLPQVVEVTFVAPVEPPPPPSTPKTVDVALKAPPIVTPQIPQLPIVIENTITVPPAPVKPVESVPAVVSAPAAPAPAAAPPAPSTPRLVTGVEYIRAPQPVYPSISRRLGETGVVTLRVLIGERGVPEQVTVQQSSGSANLDEAGRQAALRSLFKPYMEDGKPVPVYVLVPINFRLS